MQPAAAPAGRLGPALLLGLLSLPLLQPLHGAPMQFFESEWLAAALGLGGALALLLGPAGRWPALAGLPLLAAAWVALQPLLLPQVYPQNHVAPTALLVWAGLLLAAGHAWRQAEAGRSAALWDRVAAALLLAGLLNAALGAVQVLAPQALPGWLLYADAKSARAATGQLRHQGHYVLTLAWALGALLWLDARGRLGGGVPGRGHEGEGWISRRGLAALGLLVLGLALSTQRAALLYAGLPLLLSLGLRPGPEAEGPRLRRALRRRALLALGLMLLATWALPPLTQALAAEGRGLDTALSRGAASAWSLRLPMWASAWAAWLQAPWTGLGYDGYAAFHAERAHALPDFRYTTHAHQLPLHLLATLGLGAGLGLLAGGVLWLRRLGPAGRSAGQALPLLLLAPAAAACLIELPTHVAHLLGPLALLLGLGLGGPAAAALGPGARRLLALGGLAGVLLLAWTLAAFVALNRPWREALPPAERWRVVEAAVAHPVFTAVAESVLDDLVPLDARGLPPAALQEAVARNARSLAWRPGRRGLYRRAALLQLAGEPAAARRALDRAAAVYPAERASFLAHLCQGRRVDTAALAPLVEHARQWPGFALPAACAPGRTARAPTPSFPHAEEGNP